MKANKEDIIATIVSTLRELVDTLPAEQKFEPGANTKLFGGSSSIDSLTLVSFIVELETVLSSEFGTEIVLTDDRAMTREKSPFESVDELANYIVEIAA
jgi:acyl carrier protein